MSIDGANFNKVFGSAFSQGQSNNDGTPKKPAEFWLNIGYEVEVQTEEGQTEKRFVSTPSGVALDTQKPLKTNSKNDNFAKFQMARNDLLAQIMEVAQKLKPGDNQILNLQIQLHRVETPVEQTSTPETNIFSKKLALVG